METNSPQPGQTISPSGAEPPAEQPDRQPQPMPAPKPQRPQPSQDTQEDEPEVELGSESAEDMDSDDGPAITWTASEFIAHDKPFGWYAALGGSAAVFAGLVFLITKDLVSVSVVIVAALILGIYAGHRPKQLEYRLDAAGVRIGPKRFNYDDFRSFSVLPEGAFSSIVFMPLKRFAVPTTIYYPPEEEDHIVAILADRLPMEQRGHDAVDRLMHRIRF